MSLEDLVELVNDLKKIPNRTTGMKVIVLDTESNLSVTYRSKKHAARELNTDESVFSNNRKTLFRG